MRLTITCDLTGAAVFRLEVYEEMEVENFIAICQYEISALKDIPSHNLSIVHNGHVTAVNSSCLKKTVVALGIADDDVILITTNRPTTSGSQPTSQAELISNLIKSIKVPTGIASNRDEVDPGESEEKLNTWYQMWKKHPERLHQLRADFPQLADAVEKSDFSAFRQAYLTRLNEVREKKRLMLDPGNPEGQRLIAEQIQRENIDYSHRFAIEHMPESYIPVTMLFIKMKINGFEVKAFIDSGAQVSILSERVANSCNILRLMDTRFRREVLGVGGSDTMCGKIHACQVQIENQFFPCNFDVLANRDIDVLIGLDILKRHRCIIDLPNNFLRFGDSVTTAFLPESEIPVRLFQKAEVDSEKLASLISLGFEEAAARNMLEKCNNDVEAAAARLLAEQTTST